MLLSSIVLRLFFLFEKYKTSKQESQYVIVVLFLHFFAYPGLSGFLMHFSKTRDFVVLICGSCERNVAKSGTKLAPKSVCFGLLEVKAH